MGRLVQGSFVEGVAASAVAASITGTVNETTLATIVIPGGLMKTNGILRVRSFWTMTSNVNGKTFRHRLGGLAGTIVGSTILTTAAYTSGFVESLIFNRSATTQFVAAIGSRAQDAIATGNAHVTSALNTVASLDLVLTAQLANAADTGTLEAYIVDLMSP